MGNDKNFETYFSLLYTIPAFPNIVLPFFGGYFVDTLGADRCMAVFISIIATGHVVFSYGLSIKSWPVMFLGRAIFGIGETSNAVANSTLLADWFLGKEMALAFGINLSISRLSSVANNIISPVLASSGGVVFASWFAAIILACGVGAAMVLVVLDRAIERTIEGNRADQTARLNSAEKTAADAKEPDPPFRFSDALRFPLSFRILTLVCLLAYGNIFQPPLCSVAAHCDCACPAGVISPFNNIASTLLLERDYFREPSSECALLDPTACQSSTNKPQNCPSSSLYQPPLPDEVTVDGTFYSDLTAEDVDCTEDAWADGCTEEYCSRLDDGILQANTIMSIPYFMAACMLPITGSFIDRYGKRAIILTIVPVILLVVHTLLAYTHMNPIPLMVGQGLAYTAMAASLWPSFSLIVEKRYTGLGFGIAFSMQNAGLSVIPLIIASIYTSSGEKYIPNVELFFVALAAAGVVVGVWLNYDDRQNGDILNKPLGEAQIDTQYEALLADEDAEETVNLKIDGDRGSELVSEDSSRLSRNSRVLSTEGLPMRL